MRLVAEDRPTHEGGCPQWDTLVDFNLGKLPFEQIEVLAEHIGSCEKCIEALSSLQTEADEDGVVGWVQRCLENMLYAEEGYAGEAECERLQAGALCRDTTLHLPHQPGAAGAVRPAPHSVGNYELGEKLGQGGMGVVYRAVQMPIHKVVALKMVLAGKHANETAIERFVREGRLLAQLQHPGIVQIFSFGFDPLEGLPYYAMEFVSGGSLEDRLQTSGPLAFHEAAELVRTVALAVAYLHKAEVIHRDLKPGNVLLAEDGTPKIADFGLAKLLDAEASGLTPSGVLAGTPPYMSPEQASGRSEEIHKPTDIWALGAILYAVLTGRPPFRGKDSLETLNQVLTKDPVRPSRLRTGIPSGLEAVCLKCLEKDRSRRYPSADALAEDLDRCLHDERPKWTPRWYHRVGRKVRRHAASILAALVLTGVATAAFVPGDPDRPLQAIERELVEGKEVTLVGETGMPVWYRWRTGEQRAQLSTDVGGSFAIQSWSKAMLELLPELPCDRYRFTAEIRHDKSDPMGEVGVFFARREYAGQPAEVHVFGEWTFNSVRGDAAFRELLRQNGVQLPPRKEKDNLVNLFARLRSDTVDGKYIDRGLHWVSGPRFKPLGDDNGQWFPVAIEVSPEQIIATWNGQSCSLTLDTIQRKIDGLGDDPLPYDTPISRGLAPKFDVRGGLGLYVRNGSACFRLVKVTPLVGSG